MEHFRKATANRHQRDYENSFALSAVNAVALAEDRPWADSFRLLLNQAHRYGLLPEHEICVKNMLREAGYVPVEGPKKNCDYSQLSDFLMKNHPGTESALVITVMGFSSRKRVCAVRKEEKAENGFCVLDTREEKRSVVRLFLRCEQLGVPRPDTDSPESIRIDKSSPSPDHPGYRYYQPNPRKNNVGDCVIRAYSAVFGVSWDEALEMVSKANEYSTAIPNTVQTDRFLLGEKGCVHHERLTRDGLGVNGVEFCGYMTAACKNGERFFAKVGSGHVVGIIPVETASGKQYAIMDSWDSSDRKIGEYFVYIPPKKEKAALPASPAAPLSLEAGARINHPGYGIGTVVTADEKYAVISFAKAGEKKLAASWVKQNCTGA